MIDNLFKFKNEITLEQLFNNNFNGTIKITKDNALMKSDIAYACVNYIASTIAKMPIFLYKVENDGNKIKVDNDLSYLIKNRPNQYASRVDFIQTLVSNVLLYGNSFAKINFKKGRVNELIILNPTVTKLEKVRGKWYITTQIDGVHKTLNYDECIHIKDLSLDGVNGLSRLEAISIKLNNKANSDKMLSDFMESGGGIKTIVNVTNKAYSERGKIKKEFDDMLSNNKTKVVVIPEDMNITNAGNADLASAEFINNLKITKEDIMAIFNINPALLGVSEKATNSNMSEMTQQFIQSLIPLINKIEMELDYKLLNEEERKSHYFKFNMSSALRGSDEDRANFYTKMIQNGLLSIDECRELEDRNKIEGGNEFYRSLNYVPISIANEYQLSKAGADIDKSDEE